VGKSVVTSLARIDLGLVDLRRRQRAQPVAFVQRQLGVELEEPADIGIGRVAPELPELVGLTACRRSATPRREAVLPIFLPSAVVSSGEVRPNISRPRPAGQVDAVDDVAPLVRAAHLQQAAIAAVQLEEVVGLQDHVVEFEEAESDLLAVEPRRTLSKDSIRLTRNAGR
jgi:hypothetical protein